MLILSKLLFIMKEIKLNFIIVFCLLSSFAAFSNSIIIFHPENYNVNDTTVIAKLLDQRRSLINTGTSTKNIDLELSSLGHLPAAVVSKSTLPDSFVLKFEIYRNLNSANSEKIAKRLKGSFPELKQIIMHPEDGSIEAEFERTTPDQIIHSFLLTLGYNGYEIK
jgi:hypothetical protein